MNRDPHDLPPMSDSWSLGREEVCWRFEAAWREGQRPRIEEFLAEALAEHLAESKRRLLVELVLLDLEYRWRAWAQWKWPPGAAPTTDSLPDRLRLEDYASRYPAFGPTDAIGVDAIAEEYRIRRQVGDAPTPAEYLERFGATRPELAVELERIDRELAAEARAEQFSPLGMAQTLAHKTEGEPGAGTRIRYIGDYEIVEEIASGGMGVVYRARQASLERTVALKLIKRGQSAWAEDVERFRLEAVLAANLDHPGIVPIFEIGQYEGQHYFSMAFVAGESLAQRVSRGPLPPRESAELLAQVCEAVAYAHSQGVIHRDLKPANILLDRQGRPHVSDFGLAKRAASESGLTVQGLPMGTASYMPPEQADYQSDRVNEVSDVYALGATLYELLTGRPPFQAATFEDTLYQVRHEEPVPPRRLNPKLPRDLETICLKCLEKEPERRYRSAAELAEDLRRYLRGEPIVARPIGRCERTWRWCRRNPVVAALGSTAAGLLVITAVVGMVGYTSTSRALRGKEAALDIASKSEKQARDSENRAIGQQKAAEAAARREAEARRRAEETVYANRISLAYQKWLGGDVQAVEALLDSSPPEMRHWEWGYLKRLCHLDLLTLQGVSGVDSPECFPQLLFSPNGKYVAFGGCLWDVTSGEALFTGASDSSSPASPWYVAFLPDSTAAISLPQWDHTMEIVGIEENAGQANRGLPADLAAVSPDGQWMVTSTAASEPVSPSPPQPANGSAQQPRDNPQESKSWVVLRHCPEGAESHRFEGAATCFSFSRDSAAVAWGAKDSVVRVVRVKTGEEWHRLAGHRSDVRALAFSPDLAVLASSAEDGTIRLWDLSTGKSRFEVRGHPYPATEIRFLERGKVMTTIGPGAAVFWDVETGQPLRRLDRTNRVPSNQPSSPPPFDPSGDPDNATPEGSEGSRVAAAMRLSPDGTKVAWGDFRVVRVWDLNNNTEFLTLRGHSAPVVGTAFSPDGSRLASIDTSGVLKIWDATRSRECSAFDSDLCRPVLSADGRFLAIAEEEIPKDADSGGSAVSNDGPGGNEQACSVACHVYDMQSGARTHRFSWKATDVVHTALAFSPSGRYLAAYAGEGRVWDLATSREIVSARGRFFLSGIGDEFAPFSPDEKSLLLQTNEGVAIWDLVEGRIKRTLPGVRTCAFSPDGKHVVSCDCRLTPPPTSDALFGDNRNVSVWEASTGRRVYSGNLEGQGAFFTPTGSAVVDYNFWGRNRLIDFANHRVTELATDSIEGLAIAPDARRYILGHPIGPSTVRDLQTSERRMLLAGESWISPYIWFLPDGRIAGGFVDPLPRPSAAYSPDGRRIFVVSPGANSLAIWDTATASELVTMQLPPAPGSVSEQPQLEFSREGLSLSLAWRRKSLIFHSFVGTIDPLRSSADTVYRAEILRVAPVHWEGRPMIGTQIQQMVGYDFSAQGTWFVTLTDNEGLLVRDALSSRRALHLPGAYGSDVALKGDTLAAAFSNGDVGLWNLAVDPPTMRRVANPSPGLTGGSRSGDHIQWNDLTISENGRWLAGRLCCWDSPSDSQREWVVVLDSMSKRSPFPLPVNTTDIRFSKDSSRVYWLTDASSAQDRKAASAVACEIGMRGLTDDKAWRVPCAGGNHLVIDPDGAWIVVAQKKDPLVELRPEARSVVADARASLASPAPSPDAMPGQGAVSLPLVTLWDLRQRRSRVLVPESEGSLVDVWATGDGRCLLAVTESSGKHGPGQSPDTAMLKVQLVEVPTGKKRFVLDRVGDLLCLSQNEERMAWVREDNTICVADARTGAEVRSLGAHRSPVQALALAGDGRFLFSAAVGDRTVRIWDLETGEGREVLRCHDGSVVEISLSPNGNQIVTVGEDEWLTLWDLRRLLATPARTRWLEKPAFPDRASLPPLPPREPSRDALSPVAPPAPAPPAPASAIAPLGPPSPPARPQREDPPTPTPPRRDIPPPPARPAP